ncbi:unnamed protein product [Didymodactylos carnosus]|uniref:C2H2-type domain-containing protein n=1 Tax=Didymodactylos carnosus TaxID=1234261 RepID=A0A8S2D990_9BILA|nr:unnamed protein product [Didymodactylos carnosus]CAF3619220.1 unnamed protein product [Didymodactylos carnosus]
MRLKHWPNRIDYRYDCVIIRARFDANKNIQDMMKAKRLLIAGEEEFQYEMSWFPEPWNFAESPGGIAEGRNPPPPDMALDAWHPLEKAQYPHYFAKRMKRKKAYMEWYLKKYGVPEPPMLSITVPGSYEDHFRMRDENHDVNEQSSDIDEIEDLTFLSSSKSIMTISSTDNNLEKSASNENDQVEYDNLEEKKKEHMNETIDLLSEESHNEDIEMNDDATKKTYSSFLIDDLASTPSLCSDEEDERRQLTDDINDEIVIEILLNEIISKIELIEDNVHNRQELSTEIKLLLNSIIEQIDSTGRKINNKRLLEENSEDDILVDVSKNSKRVRFESVLIDDDDDNSLPSTETSIEEIHLDNESTLFISELFESNRSKKRYTPYNRFLYHLGLDLCLERVLNDKNDKINTHAPLPHLNTQQMEMLTIYNKALNPERLHSCKYCQFNTDSYHVMENHYRTPHSILNRNNTTSFKKYQCTYCTFKTFRLSQLKQHFENRHGRHILLELQLSQYTCSFCPYETDNQDRMKKHKTYCEQKFVNSNMLNENLALTIEQNGYVNEKKRSGQKIVYTAVEKNNSGTVRVRLDLPSSSSDSSFPFVAYNVMEKPTNKQKQSFNCNKKFQHGSRKNEKKSNNRLKNKNDVIETVILEDSSESDDNYNDSNYEQDQEANGLETEESNKKKDVGFEPSRNQKNKKTTLYKPSVQPTTIISPPSQTPRTYPMILPRIANNVLLPANVITLNTDEPIQILDGGDGAIDDLYQSCIVCRRMILKSTYSRHLRLNHNVQSVYGLPLESVMKTPEILPPNSAQLTSPKPVLVLSTPELPSSSLSPASHTPGATKPSSNIINNSNKKNPFLTSSPIMLTKPSTSVSNESSNICPWCNKAYNQFVALIGHLMRFHRLSIDSAKDVIAQSTKSGLSTEKNVVSSYNMSKEDQRKVQFDKEVKRIQTEFIDEFYWKSVAPKCFIYEFKELSCFYCNENVSNLEHHLAFSHKIQMTTLLTNDQCCLCGLRCADTNLTLLEHQLRVHEGATYSAELKKFIRFQPPPNKTIHSIAQIKSVRALPNVSSKSPITLKSPSFPTSTMLINNRTGTPQKNSSEIIDVQNNEQRQRLAQTPKPLSTSTEKKFGCRKCNTGCLFTFDEMVNHLKIQHVLEVKLLRSCLICQRTFPKGVEYNMHVLEHVKQQNLMLKIKRTETL